MKRVYAIEKNCIDCKLCEVYCKTAHSRTKDIIKAHKTEQPEP
ncbi:MAG: 4Fe-4S ferredoxin, partial [Clostridiaceae bacterium]|nr:4Fe-4S ferredoxin [Clostridiaceae bacterium]